MHLADIARPLMQRTKLNFILAIVSGLMLGFSFPPVPTGVFAAVAFIPLFIAFESIESYGEAFRCSYMAFLVFNIVALYWAGGFTEGKDWYMMVAGALLLLAHPFFFFIPIAVWLFFRRQYGFKISLIAFPFFWVAFEYVHSLWEIGFPWLTLGNTQTYDLSIVQIASLSGVYGLSFWLLSLNVLAYVLYAKIAVGDWKPVSWKPLLLGVIILAVYTAPKLYGNYILSRDSLEQDGDVRIGLVQPNIDPFEKWTSNSGKQFATLQRMTKEIAPAKVDLVLWPETAVPFYVLHPSNAGYFESLKGQVNRLGVNLLTGIPDIVYYISPDEAPKSSKISVDGRRYDTFNSSLLLRPDTNEVQRYAKIALVPFAERVPFSETLHFLNTMQWNFGLGGWGIGQDTTVFHCKTRGGEDVGFSTMICYESAYPSLVSAFVRKGAKFLTVITNDSWWGNTSGAYQHERLAVLRAVENRRWITQCANGGVSCFVDPYGRIVGESRMYDQKVLIGSVRSNSALTPYVRLGDWLPELSVLMSLFYAVGAIGKKVYHRIRAQQETDVVM